MAETPIQRAEKAAQYAEEWAEYQRDIGRDLQANVYRKLAEDIRVAVARAREERVSFPVEVRYQGGDE